MQHSEQIDQLSAALSKAQAAVRAVAFDATNPFLKNKYASHGALLEAIRPHLGPNGLALVQFPISDGERIGVETIVTHTSGQWMSERFTIPFGAEKGKSPAQVAGSIISYCKRYGLPGVFCLYGEDDQDGNAPSVPHREPEPGESFEAATPEPPKRQAPAPAAPSDEPTPIPDDAIEICGYLKAVTKKPTTKGGTRYGILIVDDPEAKTGGTWLNTFDDVDGARAEALKGKQVACAYVEDKWGKNLCKRQIIEA